MTTTDNCGVDEAASTSSPSAPAQRPRLWIMWANVALSWSGLALLYLMFLTFKNIRWARRNSQPWFRYAAPLTTLASAIVVLGILGSLITSSDLRNPARATPLGSSNSSNEPAAAPVVPVGPIEPVASSPEGTIRAIEAYRIKAYATGDPAPLVNYYAVGNNQQNDILYQVEIDRVNSLKTDNLVGHASVEVTKVEIVSATSAKMVANVTIKEAIDGRVTNTQTYHERVYIVVGNRWLESNSFLMPSN